MIVDSSLEMSANKQARETFVPDFDLIDTFVTPWSNQAEIAWNGQIITMGILVSLACGLVGSFIVVRKLALMGDAISHGILPGLALAFIIMQSRALFPMFFGACLAGMLCSLCIEWLQKKSILKPDAALGLTFTAFFAFGILLIAIRECQKIREHDSGPPNYKSRPAANHRVTSPIELHLQDLRNANTG